MQEALGKQLDEAESSDTSLVSSRERARITSGARLSIALLSMVALIVLGLTGLIFLLVSRVFDSLTPAVTRDLEWMAQRGAVELSKTAELGILIKDASVIENAAADYIKATDFVTIVATDGDNQVVFHYGTRVDDVRAIMNRPSGHVHSLGDRFVAWAPATIEGQEVGRVAVAISTARLRAGDTLRSQLSISAVTGGVVAMLLALGFVGLFIWPVIRLTEHAFQRLEHTTYQALEAARVKAQFLANMSHEIRTPMNAVVGLSKLMLGMPLNDKLRRYASSIEASSRALLGIINDVLDFSKLEAGKYQILPSPCELVTVIQDVAELLAERANEKGIDLVYRLTPEVPRIVELDGDRVRQVLTNLVGNAVKFTERGEVYIVADARKQDDEHVEIMISVHDTGPGVAPDLQANIFEAFSQGDGTLVRKHGGTGLGLTISKELVRLMGGHISLESELGKGSVFSFLLPARIIDATPAMRAQATSIGRRALVTCDNEHARQVLAEHVTAWGMQTEIAGSPDEAEDVLRSASARGEPVDIVIIAETQSGGAPLETIQALRKVNDTPPPIVLLSQARSAALAERAPQITVQLPQPARMSELYECISGVLQPGRVRPENHQTRHASQNFRGVRVLVVDDNQMNQFVAAEQLALFGCTVDQAHDGQQAVDAVLSKEYAVVFMDCQMPVMDGYTATRTIREREPAGKRSVIIALTAHALEGERDRVMAAGMDDYLTKPLRAQSLQRALERWVRIDPSRIVSAPPEPAVSKRPSIESEGPNALAESSTALLELFLSQVPLQVEELDGALVVGDLQEAKAHAHKLKGSLLTVGAESLAGVAQAAQHAAEREDVAEAEALVATIVEGIVQLEKRVKAELSARKRASRGGAHA